jgi:hypothetical protein
MPIPSLSQRRFWFCSNLLQMLLQGLQLPLGTTRLAPLKAGKTCSSVRFSVVRQKMHGMES